MSFTFYNPRKLDSDEVNPYATIMQKAIANHQAEEKLKKQRLENQYYGRGKESYMALQAAQAGLANANTGYVGEQSKWYGPIAQSEIGLQGAQTSQANANAGYLGQQSKYYGRDIESQIASRAAQAELANANTGYLGQLSNYYGRDIESQIASRGAQTSQANANAGYLGQQSKYYGRDIESQIASRGAQAQQAQSVAMKNAMLQKILSGQEISGPQNQGGNQIPQPSMQGQGMFPHPQGPQQNPNEAHMNVQSIPNESKLSFPQITAAMEMMGLGKPKFIESDGKTIAITPFGNKVVNQGPNNLQKELSKQDAKQVGQLDAAVLNSGQKEDTLNEVASILSDPTFKEMRQNPILGKHELGWFSNFGTPEQQKMVGDFRAYTGQIIKDSAKDFGGQFRVGEQGLLNSMKPNDSDSLAVMQGKAQSLMYMVSMIKQRAQIESELIRNGSSPVQAKIAADKMVDTKKIKEEIKNKVNPQSQNDLSSVSDEELKRIAGIK